MKKAFTVLVTLCLSALVLTGCADTGSEDYVQGNVTEITMSLKDGRTVPCLYVSSVYQAGLSCDWERAR